MPRVYTTPLFADKTTLIQLFQGGWMNKRILLALAAAPLLATAAFAAQNDAGCGVGSLIFKENNAVQQVLAATTNGSFGNQTFGITTGTLGCTSTGGLKAQIQRAQKNYVAANYRNLSREMAAGSGEYLSSLSDLLGCSRDSVADFGKLTQSKYEAIFPTKDAPAAQVLESIKTQIKSSGLSCGLI